MSPKECCKNCRHCIGAEKASVNVFGWCRLRKIKVHFDIAQYMYCHHWTQKAPALPRIDENMQQASTNRQLEFGRAISSVDK